MKSRLFDFNKKKENVTGLTTELKALYISEYYEINDNSLILVANSLYEANYLYQSLSKYNDKTFLFPMDDFLTSEALAVSPELKITRLETLNEIVSSNKVIVVTNLMGYLRFLPSADNYINSFIKLRKGLTIKPDELVKKLFSIGYSRETIINKTGDIAVRGYVIDVFPISEEKPIRIEFWGDEIDSIRVFNIENQLTISSIESVVIKPNSEFITDSTFDMFDVKHRDLPKYTSVVNLLSFLKHPMVFYDDYNNLNINYNNLLQEMHEYSLSINLPTETRYMFNLTDFLPDSINFSQFDMMDNNSINYQSSIIEPFVGSSASINARLNTYLENNDIVIICLDNRYHANKILDELDNNNIVFSALDELVYGKINLIVKNITDGFVFNNIVVISEKEIFNKKSTDNVYKTKFKIGSKIRDISKLNVGDYIVHQVHGIGRYLGIKMLIKNGMKKDYLSIEYKDNDKLYIPVEKIDSITKYSSNEGLVPKLSKLGGTEWSKTKIRVKEKAASIAKDLLKLYAEREKKIGFSYAVDGEEQKEFEQEFAYEPTIDQIRVTEEIKNDMEDKHPMDRLVCGDVGFGKTELAFRAMFKAIMSNKQVALLCPTTILSQQHYDNAIARFKSFDVNIAILNRFVTPMKSKKILNDLKDGKIDILIGTHRILSDDVVFKNLGLLVIDEEQRFGVKHKEKIKEYKNNIDVLTLSATPIPRTLQMSIAGIRSLSLLETPPQNRYPIQTYVLAYNNQIIKDAIYKELSRNGQLFILFNNIKSMSDKAVEIQKLVPQARIVTANGQMNKTDLEDIMFRFINKEYDVLLCTTIIETGIDIPNVNTLIIIDADKFGLSQLYQIRGRVGRSNKIAYCYLMYDNKKILSEIAVKRLKVIKEFTELGSGFSIAMRDLSIRGAGNILGSEQSGYIDSVGVELFMKMLEEEIAKASNKKITEVSQTSEPLVEVETNISDNYVSEEDLKIEIHRSINEIDSFSKLEDTKAILEDRFGTLPKNLITYMYEEWFEKEASSLGINRIKQGKNSIEVYLPIDLSRDIDGEKLFMDLYSLSKMFRISMKNRQIVIVLDIVNLPKHFIYYLIDMLEVIKKSIKK